MITDNGNAPGGTQQASRAQSPHPTPERRSASSRNSRSGYSSTTAACHCGAEWPIATNTAHCGACHRSFTSLSAFDKHRDGSHAGGMRHCRRPESVGLVGANRAYPCWGHPNDGTWAGPQ